MNMTPSMFMCSMTTRNRCLTSLWKRGKVREVNVREKKGVPPLSLKDQKVAEQFVRVYADNIIDKWTNFFIKKKRVVCTTIKKRLK